MVLIIGNRHIKSRDRTKLNKFYLNKSQIILNSTVNNRKFIDMSFVRVLGILFLYSVAMFTLPFIAFFGVQHLLMTHYHVDKFTSNCSAVLAAVVAVNIVIACYAYQAMNEPDDPKETEEIADEQIIDSHNKME